MKASVASRSFVTAAGIVIFSGSVYAANPDQTRARMDKIFGALVSVLPLSLNGAE